MHLVTGASGFIGKHLLDALAPKLIDRILNTGFRLFPDSPKKGKEGDHRPPGPEAVAFAHIMHGIHW